MSNPTTTTKPPSLRKAAERAVEALEATAAMCELWAAKSQQGGWSTHQVKANRDLAAQARREAGALRRALRENQE